MLIDVKNVLSNTSLADKAGVIAEVIGDTIEESDISKLAARHGMNICGANVYTLAIFLRKPIPDISLDTRELPEMPVESVKEEVKSVSKPVRRKRKSTKK